MDKKEYDDYMFDLAADKLDFETLGAIMEDRFRGSPSLLDRLIGWTGVMLFLLILATTLLAGCGGGAVEYQKATDPSNLWSVQKTIVVERGSHANTGQ